MSRNEKSFLCNILLGVASLSNVSYVDKEAEIISFWMSIVLQLHIGNCVSFRGEKIPFFQPREQRLAALRQLFAMSVNLFKQDTN